VVAAAAVDIGEVAEVAADIEAVVAEVAADTEAVVEGTGINSARPIRSDRLRTRFNPNQVFERA
jgi:hypothetical protein